QPNEGQVVLEAGRGERVRWGVTEEEAVLTVDHGDGSDHDNDERGRGAAAQQANDQPQTAEELADGDGIAEQSHTIGRGLDHRRQARPTEGPEQLLRTVDDKDDSDNDAHHEQSEVYGRAVSRLGIHAAPRLWVVDRPARPSARRSPNAVSGRAGNTSP